MTDLKNEPPETIYKAVERALDECSAWIARPDVKCTKKVALAAGIAWSLYDPHEPEQVALWMIERSYATGHGDTIGDMLGELVWQVRAEQRALLIDLLAFIQEEADNRAAAGSEMSDYEREPRDLADRIGEVLR